MRGYPDMDDSPFFSQFPSFFAIALHVVRLTNADVQSHVAACQEPACSSQQSATTGPLPILRVSLPPLAPVGAPQRPRPPRGLPADLAEAAASAMAQQQNHEELVGQVVTLLLTRGAATLSTHSRAERAATVRALALVTDALALQSHR